MGKQKREDFGLWTYVRDDRADVAPSASARSPRPFNATPSRQSPELRRRVSVLGSRCSPGTLTCHATQPRTTFARCTPQALPSAFVIAWAQGR